MDVICLISFSSVAAILVRMLMQKQYLSKSFFFCFSNKRIITTEKRLEAEQFDLPLPLYKIGCGCIWSTWTRPVHFALAEAYCIDIMAVDLQDEPPVHHIQQTVCEDHLLVIGDVLCGRESQLLQVHRSKQLLLVDHGAQVSVEQPAALGVTDSHHGTHLLPSV